MLQAASVLAVPFTAAGVFIATSLGMSFILRRKKPVPPEPVEERAKVFLFDGTSLIDATHGAEEILSLARVGGSDWARMLSVLGMQFPGLAARLAEIDEHGTIGMRSKDGSEQLIATSLGQRIRITLSGAPDEKGRMSIDPMVFRALLREIETLRTAADSLPFPVWRQSAEGVVVWANRAYLQAAGITRGGTAEGSGIGPLTALFDGDSLGEIVRDGNSRRLQPRLLPETAKAEWYECRAVPAAGDQLFSAVPIDAAVRAERQLRDFMQTLTKTFSHLATGLAIFDRQRRLAMFNPALTDLTGLPVDFLASRPTLYSVLDRLRDRRMIPEPKDYGTWRRQISELEAAALDGTYSETWSLPDGRTYRVTGRPHHGGAMAFLFEDISSEVSLTRRFRSELELGQAVIDALDAAVIVFSSGGNLSMVNTGYHALWGSDVGDTVDLPTVTELSRHWMARATSPLWGDIRDFVLHARDREAWEDTVTLKDGTRLECRVAPVSGGSTMVSFRVLEPPVPERRDVRATA